MTCSASWAIARMVGRRQPPGSRLGSTIRPVRPTSPPPTTCRSASSPSTSVRSSNAKAPGAESPRWSSPTEHVDKVSAPGSSKPPSPSPSATDAFGWRSQAVIDGRTRTGSTSAAGTSAKLECRPASYGTCRPATGSRTVTQSPPSARGLSESVPSCACTMLLTIARPRPTPA
jgi:hypothetical protein